MLHICNATFRAPKLRSMIYGWHGAFNNSVSTPQHLTMIATLDRLLALSRKLHDARVQSESEPIYVGLTLNELQLLKRLADDYLEEAEAVMFESRSHADAA